MVYGEIPIETTEKAAGINQAASLPQLSSGKLNLGSMEVWRKLSQPGSGQTRSFLEQSLANRYI